MANRPFFVSTDVISQVITWPDAVEAIRAIYAVPHDPAEAPPRTVARRGKTWLRSLTCVLPTGTYMGAKLFGLGRQRAVSYLVALFDQETGELACLVDGDSLTAYRTAATSAVALAHIAGPEKIRLGILGSGAEARSHVRALAAVRPIERLCVYSPSETNRQAFAHVFTQELGIPCQALDSPRAVAEDCTVLVAAARSRDETPTFQSAWVNDEAFVISIGSTLPEQREVEPALIARASAIIADAPDEVSESTGDFIAATRAGIDFGAKMISLNQLLMGERAPPREGLVLFKSVGSALQDLAVAELAFRRAAAQGLAVPLAADFSLKTAAKR